MEFILIIAYIVAWFIIPLVMLGAHIVLLVLAIIASMLD